MHIQYPQCWFVQLLLWTELWSSHHSWIAALSSWVTWVKSELALQNYLAHCLIKTFSKTATLWKHRVPFCVIHPKLAWVNLRTFLLALLPRIHCNASKFPFHKFSRKIVCPLLLTVVWNWIIWMNNYCDFRKPYLFSNVEKDIHTVYHQCMFSIDDTQYVASSELCEHDKDLNVGKQVFARRHFS